MGLGAKFISDPDKMNVQIKMIPSLRDLGRIEPDFCDINSNQIIRLVIYRGAGGLNQQ